MNFRSAHRRRAWARLSRALRLCVACAALPVMVMAAPGFAACGRPGGRVQAVSVDQRLDIALSDGRTVRLGGLDAPSADRGAPEIANAAQDFLSRRLLGREADLILLATPTDRWGRTIADLSLPDSAAGIFLWLGWLRWRRRGRGFPLVRLLYLRKERLTVL